MRRDTMRDLFGRDLVHLALVLALLRFDVPYSRQPLGQRSNNILADLDPYQHTLSRHKAVLEDLHSLGRFSQPSPSGGIIGSSTNRWGGITGLNPAPIEISAYVLNTERDLPEGILQDVLRPSTSSGIGSPSLFSSASTRTHTSISECESAASFVSDVDSGIENNFGDFGGYESSQSAGIRSPSSVTSGSECASINSPQPSANNEFDLDLDLDFDLGPTIPDIDGDPFGLLSGESVLLDSHQSDLPRGLNILETQDTNSLISLFSPDEEDLENQLMHIDDQLIRLDDDLENINEGLDQRTLDQAIMVHNLGPEGIVEGLGEAMEEYPFQDEDSNVGLESILGAEEQDFLFSALEHDEPSVFTESLLDAADGVTEVNPFDDWQADTNRELGELLHGSMPDSNVRPPPPAVTESVVKTEIKVETEDIDEDTLKAIKQRKVDSEPEKKLTVVKEEPVSEEDDDEDDYDETTDYVHGAAGHTSVYFNNNNDIDDKKHIQLGGFNPQIQGSNLRRSSTDNVETPNAHLIDHNYATSTFDECFGDSWKAEKTSGASNIDFYGLYEDGSNPSSPTSSIATSYEGASVISGSASSSGFRESRDERKVRQNGLPLSCSQIIDSSMEEFNDLLTRHTMTEEQTALCRDIRRRGKNKVAAQNCRKRKLNLISHLQDEVDKYRQSKQSLLAERQELYRMRNEWTNKLLTLEDQVLRGLGKSTDNYSLELMPHSQQIRIAQRHTSSSTATTRRHLTKPSRA